jgi:putative DNA primase/helicase
MRSRMGEGETFMDGMTAKPTALIVKPDTIPGEIKAPQAWVTWRYELDKRQDWTKVPYQQDGRVRASTTDPETWASFEEVIDCYQSGGVDGIGFVLTNGIAGVDLDHCFDENRKFLPWALKIMFSLDSYSEFSPSGNGIRIFLKASLPPGGRKKDNVEMYDTARYLTVTGHHRAGTPLTIESRQDAIEALHHRTFSEPKIDKPVAAPDRMAPRAIERLEDAELLERAFRARNGDKTRQLFGGDTSAHGCDNSAADLALCSLLGWYTDDPQQLDRLFRASKLFREKWDERHYSDGRTYGEGTILKAMERRN